MQPDASDTGQGVEFRDSACSRVSMSSFCGNFSCGLWVGALPPSPHLPLLLLTEHSADGLKDLDLLNWLDLPQVLVSS